MDKKTQFSENQKGISGKPSTPDESPERLSALRTRIVKVPFAAELLDIEDQVAAPAVFDRQLESVGRCFMDNGAGKPVVAIHPAFTDDKIASFYVHELTHLRQACLAGTVNITHPLTLAENFLMSMFVREADAYMRQYLFSCAAFMAGDTAILEDLTQKSAVQLFQEGIPQRETAALLDKDPAQFLNESFWFHLKNLTSTRDLARGYFDDAMEILRQLSGQFAKMTFEQLQDVDSLPAMTGVKDAFDALRPLGTFSPKNNDQETDYLAGEDSETFFDKFFAMLPEDCRKEFAEEKKNLITSFYGAMDATRPEADSTPKLWTPKQP